MSEISKEEFCSLFVERMVAVAGETFGDGSSVRQYAETTAPTYWDEPDQREEGPEACADSDISYWED